MGLKSYNSGMEQLIAEIEAYQAKTGIKPQLLLKRAMGYGWSVWPMWKSGEAQCTLASAQKIRDYIHNNNPSHDPALTAADAREVSCPPKNVSAADAPFKGAGQ
jgi:hypothetical protein